MSDLLKAIRYQHPERLPVSVSLLPATWARHGDALTRICQRYPELFGNVASDAATSYYTPPSYHAGQFTDPWGCVWSNVAEGYESIVTGHPLPHRQDVRKLRAPDVDMGLPHGFMFLRLMDLRGFEEIMVDFAEEPPELQMLIDIVRDYNVRQMKLMLKKSRDELIYVGDDNGMQDALPISPAKWRKYLKPAYKAIYDVAHADGRLVYMHTDGCIFEVMPDMQEAGADMINPQIRANSLDNLVRVCRGRIPINLDLDRQLFPFASPERVREHIFECVRALYLPEGGLGLMAECGADVPLDVIDMICRTLSEARDFHI